MAATLPKVLHNFNLYLDSTSYAGRISELTLPTLSVQTEEFRAGGMDAPIMIDLGMEAMEAEFVLAEYDSDVIGLFGLGEQGSQILTAKGALMGGDGAVTTIDTTMNGSITSFDPGSYEAGSMTEASFTFACRSYKLTLGGTVIIDIDIELQKRSIGGVDQLKSVAEAL
jgi:P2 family phage contractile tail tube protein